MERSAAVAGTFYPDSPNELRHEVETLLNTGAKASPAVAAVAPHAGYIYSGKVAGEVFSRLEIPSTVIILTPDHTGAGKPFAVWPEGNWETPLGKVAVDEELARELIAECPPLTSDFRGHLREHAGEVMLPFLQFKRPDVRVVVVVMDMADMETLQALGLAIAGVMKRQTQLPLLLASSDMTHFKSDAVAREQDQAAIDAILKLDEQELYQVVTGRGITMCGIASVTTTISAAKKLGARGAELIMYDTSASASGDTSNVVGYAGLILR